MARDQKRAALLILTTVFGSLGLGMLIITAALAGVRASETAGFRHAEGTVVAQVVRKSGRSDGYSPVIEFSTPGGAQARFTSGVINNPPVYEIGERLPVIYAPDDPSHAFIARFWEIWLLPMIFFFIGMPFVIAGSVCFVVSRKRAGRTA